ncbi:YceD family protein [Alicyclobacillus acidoterrestris]|uniref:DUF177 domain-containing protein n=1 Tax=Alicyclobacillus acidoterrestris (strain ATCC 49025 / DSM 3922 / CIP 106132 / NCIMB 13137 / GD3B) TaxID=1356854 RepID=T0CGG7_ALIAG|nr:DUF177 domain-containing protein [Alicyclobacillus acidoterrestris]EPZ51580.1 hypothetical protein N007_03200 [Alicyclobacillus acidoterrestris ATCC 49025]UNO50638.1 DUF177 domain-containing protein [Alicyclobacillus acidoterrestris]
MQLNIKSIKREGNVEFDQTERLTRITEEVVDVKDIDPARITGTATWADPIVLVEGTIDTNVHYVCSRCLTEFERPLSTRLSRAYAVDAGQAEEDIPLVEGELLDLTPDIEESVFLSLDERPLCQADCQGLCAECGCNRNHETCSCDTRKIDPRLAALKDLLSDDETEYDGER